MPTRKKKNNKKSSQKKSKTTGRPSTYSPDICQIICNELAGGASLRNLCATRDDLPAESTIFLWLAMHPDFSEQYARARESWADAEFENLMQIADTPMIGSKTTTTDETSVTVEADMIEHRRLQVETRKWALGKLHPKKYGDKTIHSGDDKSPITVSIIKYADNPASE